MQRPPMIAAKRTARAVEASAREAAISPWSVRLARSGYVAKGVVYLLVGTLAAMAALGRGGETTDNRGALVALSERPYGHILVALVAVGLFAYALWLFVDAALDPERKGADAKGVATRVGSAALGCSYAALGVVAAGLALRRGGGEGSDQATRDWTARLLAYPLGAALVALIGAAVLGAAGFFFWRAVTARFRDELDLRDANAAERVWVVPLGRAGHAALGAVDATVGIFLIIAAVRRDAGEAKGLGDALAVLAQRPYGGTLLGAVALGLVAYAAYTFAEARYRRLVR